MSPPTIYLYLRNFPADGQSFNNRYAGLIKSVHGLASGLAAAGVRVTVLSEALPDVDTVKVSLAGYTIRSFAQPVQQRPTFRLSPGLKRFVREQIQPTDLVILNGIMHPTVGSLGRMLRRQSVPYIVAPTTPIRQSFFAAAPTKSGPTGCC